MVDEAVVARGGRGEDELAVGVVADLLSWLFSELMYLTNDYEVVKMQRKAAPDPFIRHPNSK